MTNKPIPAHCDAGCKKEFETRKIRTRKVKHGIEKNYFRCPHCKHEYVTFYTSEETRRLQKEMRELTVAIRTAPSVEENNANLEEYVAMKERIKQSMDDARKIVEG